MGSDLQRPVDRSLSTDQSLGEEFSPAGAGCRYRAPLTPRLARPFFPRVLSSRRTNLIFARQVSRPTFRAAGLPTHFLRGGSPHPPRPCKSYAAARRSASTPKYTTPRAQSKRKRGTFLPGVWPRGLWQCLPAIASATAGLLGPFMGLCPALAGSSPAILWRGDRPPPSPSLFFFLSAPLKAGRRGKRKNIRLSWRNREPGLQAPVYTPLTRREGG